MITIGSNGIRQMIAQAGRSKYVTPRMPWWGWVLIGLAISWIAR
jgi:hypothetical protein